MAEPNPYAQKRVLYHWHALPGPPALTANQVTVGPCYETVKNPDGTYVSLNVPFGTYDIKTVVDKLPASQRPEALVVAIDSTRSSVPRNLAALDCPKALLLGDTHHLDGALRFPYGYLLAEQFDLLVGNHLPQHLHFFWHAKRSRIAWIPGAWVRNFPMPFLEVRPLPPVFVGQMGDYHPVRRRMLEAIRDAGIQIDTAEVDTEEAARRYAQSALTFNCSLNGDVNMRVFEALGHGGFLVTDRLAPEVGLERLFRDGEALVTYKGIDDLIVLMRHYAARPDEAMEIARNGYDLYRLEHTPTHKARQLLSALFNDNKHPAPLWSDKRAEDLAPGEDVSLLARIQIYEHAQEHNRTSERLTALATADVDGRTLCDVMDLSRLSLARLAPDGDDQVGALVERLGYTNRIAVLKEPAPVQLLFCSAQEFRDGRVAPIIAAAKPQQIVLTGRIEGIAAQDEAAARRLGFQRVGQLARAFART